MGQNRISSEHADHHWGQRQARVGQELEHAAAAEAPDPEGDSDRQADHEGEPVETNASRSVTQVRLRMYPFALKIRETAR